MDRDWLLPVGLAIAVAVVAAIIAARRRRVSSLVSSRGFTFRLRFDFPASCGISAQESALPSVTLPNGCEVRISSLPRNLPVRDAKHIEVQADGFSNAAEAEAAAEAFRSALVVTMAHLRMGADFGDRAPASSFSQYGLQRLEVMTRNRVLNDVHGIMVYETSPRPRFVRMAPASLSIGVALDVFVRVLQQALDSTPDLTQRERLAFHLYSASFFEEYNPEARLLLLVMAVEALLRPERRTGAAAKHVQEIIRLTKGNTDLSSGDRNSLLGSLKWLKDKSINQTARDLIEDRLGGQEFAGMGACRFWSRCYQLRSRLVHGHEPVPSRDELGKMAAEMESFVSALIAAPYLPRAS